LYDQNLLWKKSGWLNLLLKDLSVLQEGAARGKSSWFLSDIIEKRLRGAMGQHKPELSLDKSATYRIVWQGHLDESWSDYVGGLTISPFHHHLNRPSQGSGHANGYPFCRVRLAPYAIVVSGVHFA
jgi:hypothetical protein